MKHLIPLSLLLFIAHEGKSQYVIGSIGGEGNAGSMNISYTVGEAAITTIENDGTILTQGFHQPSYEVVSAIQETFLPGAIRVFPNPTSSNLQVQLEGVELENITISLRDVLGRSILTSKTDAAIWQTDLSGLASGYYLLTVADLKNHQSNSFKILKFD